MRDSQELNACTTCVLNLLGLMHEHDGYKVDQLPSTCTHTHTHACIKITILFLNTFQNSTMIGGIK